MKSENKTEGVTTTHTRICVGDPGLPLSFPIAGLGERGIMWHGRLRVVRRDNHFSMEQCVLEIGTGQYSWVEVPVSEASLAEEFPAHPSLQHSVQAAERTRSAPDPSRAAPQKPPLGVMPREIWIEKRKQDLRHAIEEYVRAGKLEPVGDWLAEFFELDARKTI